MKNIMLVRQIIHVCHVLSSIRGWTYMKKVMHVVVITAFINLSISPLNAATNLTDCLNDCAQDEQDGLAVCLTGFLVCSALCLFVPPPGEIPCIHRCGALSAVCEAGILLRGARCRARCYRDFPRRPPCTNPPAVTG